MRLLNILFLCHPVIVDSLTKTINSAIQLTGSPDNVASAQQIYTSSVAAIALAPARNYGTLTRDAVCFAFILLEI
jgi:hypothetical protein